MRQVDVVGVGITPFGKHADATVRSLGADAIGMALADAGPAPADGGLVSRGHPVGATGCAQLAELVTQLRGQAGDRQVPGARVGAGRERGRVPAPGPGRLRRDDPGPGLRWPT